MPNVDERTITMHVVKWNVVMSCLQLVGSIISDIQEQAAAQERVPANGLDEATQTVTAD